MASVVSVLVSRSYVSGKDHVVQGTLSVAAGNYATGGNTVDLSAVPEIKSSKLPVAEHVHGQAGYDYTLVNGADKSTCLLKICTSGGAEVAAGATPAGITGDTISFELKFPALR